jgi:hypothetical protein
MGHARATAPTSPGRNERLSGAVIDIVRAVVDGLVVIVGWQLGLERRRPR